MRSKSTAMGCDSLEVLVISSLAYALIALLSFVDRLCRSSQILHESCRQGQLLVRRATDGGSSFAAIVRLASVASAGPLASVKANIYSSHLGTYTTAMHYGGIAILLQLSYIFNIYTVRTRDGDMSSRCKQEAKNATCVRRCDV